MSVPVTNPSYSPSTITIPVPPSPNLPVNSLAMAQSKPNYRKALLYGTIAAISILGTLILSSFALMGAVGAIFSATLMTLDGGFSALFTAAGAALLGHGAWQLGKVAWIYCKKTHYALNP